MTQELVITRGLPASGKTTWARAWVGNDPLRYARVSRDDIRGMLFGAISPIPAITGTVHFDAYRAYFEAPDLHVRESAVTAAEVEAVRGLLENGRNVVVDDTNLRLRYVRQWAELAGDCGAEFRIQDFSHVPTEECVQRDFLRGGKVGAKVINDMAERFKNASRALDEADDVVHGGWRYEMDQSLPYAAWLCDVDGTLALKGDRSPYDYVRVSEDLPNRPVMLLLDALERAGYWIVVVSGREGTEQCRADTGAWLRQYSVPFNEVHMRAEGDKRSDEVVKMEMLQEIAKRYRVVGAIDDRNRVVRMWRRVGLICLQVADGAF